MFRSVLAELFSFGGGHALGGRLTRALAWAAAAVVTFLSFGWTPWGFWVFAAVRFASLVDAGRLGRRGAEGGRWHWKPMLAFLVVTFGFVLAVNAAVIQFNPVPSSGMSPTLLPGDNLVSNKVSLRWRAPARGEVVTYRVGRITFVGRVVALGGDEIAVRGGIVHLNGAAVTHRMLGEDRYVTEDDDRGNALYTKATAASEELGGRRYRVLVGGGLRPADSDFPSEQGPGCGGDPELIARYGGVALEPGRDATWCRVPAGTVFIAGDNRANSFDSRLRGAFPVASVTARVVGVWFGPRGFGSVRAID